MQIDEQLNEVLNNFSQINASIVFKPGNVVSTIKPSKAVMAKAKVTNAFDSTFAVYNLSQLLQLLSLYENPEMDILDTHMLIRQGTEVTRFTFCDPELVATPPDDAGLEKLASIAAEGEIKFTLSNDALTRLRKFAATMGSPEIAVTGDGENIYIEALNTKNSADNTYRAKVGETSDKFRMVFLCENLVFLPRDYEVQIAARGLAYFKTDDVEYWVAAESNSQFGE